MRSNYSIPPLRQWTSVAGTSPTIRALQRNTASPLRLLSPPQDTSALTRTTSIQLQVSPPALLSAPRETKPTYSQATPPANSPVIITATALTRRPTASPSGGILTARQANNLSRWQR